jgi:glutathione peroxidase
MDAALLQRKTLGRLAVFLAALGFAAMTHAAGSDNACPPLLDAAMPTLTDDKPQSLCQFKGKVLLVVNTASQCGYTPQYEGLEKLYKRYKDKGLVVLGFPSNDFRQESGSSKEIAAFCEANYGVSFPMFDKSSVARGNVNPFYANLAKTAGAVPAWNFHKYLIDRRGEKVQSFPAQVDPGNQKLVKEIERLLAEKGGVQK